MPLRLALVYGHEESAKVLMVAGATSDPTVGLYFAQQIWGAKYWKLKKNLKKNQRIKSDKQGKHIPSKN